MLVPTPVSPGVDLTRSLAVMATMNRMLKPLFSGVWNVSKSVDLVLTKCHYYYYHYLCLFIDVKMDWCNTNINGTQLDPKVQYAQMVNYLW